MTSRDGWSRSAGRNPRTEDSTARARRRSSPSALARAAGAGNGDFGVEALEQRKLLFTVSIATDTVDPATGLGVASGWFGYAAPTLFFQDPDPQDPVFVTEGFDDEDGFWTQFVPQIPPRGTVFNESNFQINYSGTGATPSRVPGPNPGQDDDFDLNVDLTGNGFVSFAFLSGGAGGGQQRPRLAQASQFVIRGLDTNAVTGSEIELLSGGTVVQRLSGNALTAISAPTQLGIAFNIAFPSGFDSVRISSVQNPPDNITYIDQFTIESITTQFPPTTFAEVVGNRGVGAEFVLRGPAGASVQFLDLYGRDMIQTIAIGVPQGVDDEIPIIDRNGDGVPDFNDGIGRIIVNGTNENSSLVMWGGTIEVGPVDPDTRFAEGGFLFKLPTDFAGLLDTLEDPVGFGYDLTDDNPPAVVGLQQGVGSIVIGAPFLRDASDPNRYLRHPGAPVTDKPSFNRADQGVFVNGSIGTVITHAVLHGSSRITGAVRTFSTGIMLGSLTVDGDAQLISVASDFGNWVTDDIPTQPDITPDEDPQVDTGNQITVGRTLGELRVGGRSTGDVLVLGDLSNPNRTALTTYDVREKEVIYYRDTNGDNREAVEKVLSNPNALNGAGIFGQTQLEAFGKATPFGNAFYRNDQLLTAEFVGGGGTAARITGFLGNNDQVSGGLDSTDVYAFPASFDSTVTVDVEFRFFNLQFNPAFGFEGTRAYARIVDNQGRTIAAHEVPAFSPNRLTGVNPAVRFTFTPDATDVYYLVLNMPITGTFGDGPTPYQVSLSGYKPTVFGSYLSAARTGLTGDPNSIILQAGDMGAFRVGTGFTDGGGGLASPAAFLNTEEDDDDLLSLRPSTLSVAGNLYGAVFGSDISGTRPGSPGQQMFIGGNLGTFRSGVNPIVGIGPGEGDVEDLTLQVGGGIGEFNVGGAIRFDQDFNLVLDPSRTVTVQTGTSGRPGDIGLFNVGQFIDATSFNLRTSNNSIIDRFLVGQAGGTGIIDEALGNFQLGSGSDVRFAAFNQIGDQVDPDVQFLLTPATPLSFTDDSGATVRFSISGGDATSVASVRVLPVNGSQGVVVGRIDGTLSAGANLVIDAPNGGVVSIGHIALTTSATARSNILISGTGEIDVYRIEQLAGLGLGLVRNSTTNGDIVAIDALSIDAIEIAGGNLGRTQVNRVGPRVIGPDLGIVVGIDGGAGGAVGGPMGVNAAAFNADMNGEVYPPVNPATSDFPDDVTLSDVGGVFDPYLNGAIIRTGNLNRVIVNRSIGDVIMQGGDIQQVTANADGITPAGGFEGIVGTIYGRDLANVDVGNGLIGPGDGPLPKAGIFADDDIGTVLGGRGLSPRISGLIIAANTNVDSAAVDGLVSLRVENGTIDDAYIGAALLDSYWRSARFWYTVADADDPTATSRIGTVRAINTDIFRSEMLAVTVSDVAVSGGAWDASVMQATLDIGTVTADEFRNTTRLGEPLENRPNLIKATRNLNRLSTNGNAGDIADLTIDIEADVTGSISARNITRATVEVSDTLVNIFSVNDIRSSTIDVGTLSQLNAGADLRSSRISASGAITSLVAGSNITSSVIESIGPSGRIDSIRSRFFLTGDITSSGPIASVVSTSGDIIGTVTTTDPADGTLGLIQAGGNLFAKLSIQSNVDRILAGLNVGAVGDEGGDRSINIRGNLNSIEATRGQVYTDLRIGGTLNTYRNARVVALPGNDLTSRASIVSYGRINALNLVGDFNGSITSFSGGIGSITITDGSYRPDNDIQAFDGGIDTFTITGGHLQGNIYADETIGSVRVLPNALGFAGDIGVNPYLSQSARFDDLRNQLPPGVVQVPTFQGPRIQSGTNIGLVEVANASMWESAIIAGHSIGRVFVAGVILNDNVTPGLGGSFITAGDTIASVEANQFVGGAIIAAGVLGLGQDGRPGGTGANADIVQFGRVGNLVFRGGTGAVTISSGMNAGPDGVYNTGDDEVADGISTIGSVTVIGPALETSAFADNGIGFTSPGIIRGGPGLNQANPGRIIEFVPTTGAVANGVPTPFTLPSGETGRITFTGPGTAYYEVVFDSVLNRTIGRLAVINSTLASRLIVDSDQGTFRDLVIMSNDGSSLGLGSVRASLFGASQFYFDGYVQNAEFGYLDTTGVIGAGNDIGQLTVGPTIGGTIFGNFINNLVIGGDVGPNAGVDFLAIGSLLIGGSQTGRVTVDRDVSSINIVGRAQGGVRAGRSIGSFQAASARDARIGAGNDIGSVRIAGDADFTQILAGTDLGKDTRYGGTGLDADRVSNGNLGPVTVGGNFRSADIGAGIARGADGFLGTSDDLVADGRSAIGTVTIGGGQVGSQFNGQSFRVTSNGSVGAVTVAGQPAETIGNFEVERLRPSNFPLQVADLRVVEESGLYTASIEFNQPINQSTLSPALRIAEIRDAGVFVQLAEGSDYFVEYIPASNTAVITFSRDLTNRSLPQQGGIPGPGVYRFELDAGILRGQTQKALLDGNADGFASGSDDSWSQDDVVGDAGDKLVNNAVTQTINGRTFTIDFYAATDLNQILDSNYSPDFLPDVNSTYTLRGTLGDHPDEDVDFFRASGDADVYRLSLRAGQVLKLGRINGAAVEAGRALLDSNGNSLLSSTSVFPTGTITTQALRVPSAVPESDDLSVADNYLITQTGTYFILVTASLGQVDVSDPNAVASLDQVVPSTLGRYDFTVEVFDDADTGFAGDTDSGDGVGVANAPVPGAFTGADGVLNTADDLAQVVVGQFTFTLNPGADNIKGTADDLVSGVNGAGITSQRTVGSDAVFGTADDRVVSFVAAAIGKGGFAGAPAEVSPDADVYRLNNGAPIAPGTRVRVTLQLTEFGSNIGLTSDPRRQDLRGDVQLAVFETSGATNVSNGLLLAAPSDLKPVGQTPNQITSNGTTSYGYDANGDFFMEFVTPGRLGVAGLSPASYAVYVQGAIRSDYTLEILTQGTGTVAPISQNVYIELRGGSFDWLQAGENVTTTATPFTVSGLGFTGFVGATPVDAYVSQQVLSRVQAAFDAAGLDVNVSSTTAGFEGSDFSTVFLSGSPEPTAFFFDGRFGYAQHADPFNTDRNDQGVVFLPQLNTLDNPQSPAGLDALINQITNATVRRIGELLGLRSVNTAALTGQIFDVLDVNSVNANIDVTIPLTGVAAQLSIPADQATTTNFYLGQQSGLPLLQKIIL
jgi:hypothetical protein